MFTLPYSVVTTSPRITRVKAYKAALAEHGLPFREELLVESDMSLEELEPKALRISASTSSQRSKSAGSLVMVTPVP